MTNKKNYAEFLIDLATVREAIMNKAEIESNKDNRDFLELLSSETGYLLRKFHELMES